jgi:hypothetical protein
MPEAGKMLNLYDIAVVSEEIDCHLELTLGCAEDAMSSEEAANLLDLLYTAVEFLSSRPEYSIAELASSFNSVFKAPKHTIQNSITSPSSRQDENLILQGSKIFDIWQSVFGHKRMIANSSLSSSPFFDVGGDLVDAARFVFTAQQHGISITLDDILKYPSLGTVVDYLS